MSAADQRRRIEEHCRRDVIDGSRSREHVIADLMFKRVTRGPE